MMYHARYTATLAVDATEGSINLYGVKGRIRLIQSTVDNVGGVTTYTLTVRTPAGATVAVTGALADNGTVIVNPETLTGANEWTNGIPVYCIDATITGAWTLLITPNAAVTTAASTWTIDILFED